MLLELKIENIGIIENLSIRFGPGLNVITGETGAGKSLLLQALDIVMGSRISSGIVRSGTARGIVEAHYDISGIDPVRKRLESLGFPFEDSFLILRRELSSEGKSRASVNGMTATLFSLKSVAALLMEIHGQHEHHRLFDQDTHLEYLDIFAGTIDLRNKVAAYYSRYSGIKNRLKTVTMEKDEKDRRLDYLKFALEEIETFEPEENEYENLLHERAMIQNSGKLFQDMSLLYGILREEEGSVLDQLSRTEEILEDHCEVFLEVESRLADVREAEFRLEAVADFLRDEKQKMNFSPERLEDIEERISGYKKLHKKYGGTTSGVLQTLDKFLRELSSIEMSDEEASLLASEMEIVFSEMKETAEELSRKRRSVVSILEEKLSGELSNLGMNGATIHLSINREMERSTDPLEKVSQKNRYVINEKGLDRVEFLLRANMGESILPLRKAASGGELSRIMLALKSIIIDGNPAGTVVFDEVDSGVGGEIANTIGRRLKDLSLQSQVMVVTHLHQIASLGDHHFQLSKETSSGRTLSRIQKLQGEKRLKEMARMLGGESHGQAVLDHARELLSRSAV